MRNQTYNGWTNYATWRVNLEFFDGVDEALDADDCRELVEQYIEDSAEGLAKDWALAFVIDVNWQEIAGHLKED